MIALPTWKECARAIETNAATPLHRLIYWHEVDGKEDADWRRYLESLISQLAPVSKEGLKADDVKTMAQFLRTSGFPHAATVLDLSANEIVLLSRIEELERNKK